MALRAFTFDFPRSTGRKYMDGSRCHTPVSILLDHWRPSEAGSAHAIPVAKSPSHRQTSRNCESRPEHGTRKPNSTTWRVGAPRGGILPPPGHHVLRKPSKLLIPQKKPRIFRTTCPETQAERAPEPAVLTAWKLRHVKMKWRAPAHRSADSRHPRTSALPK